MRNFKFNEIRPIIVIGMNRSGTKWLSNILCNHAEVACVQSVEAKGILESVIMNGVMGSKFNLAYPEDYAAAIELLSLSNFFRIAKGQKETFYRLKPRPNNLYEVFDVLMCNYAKKNCKRYWLQKTSPWEIDKVLAYFRYAYFIVIKRNIVDNLKSTLKFNKEKGIKRSLIKLIYTYILQEKILEKIRKRHNVMYVEYEKLVLNTENIIRKVCDFIGLRYDCKILDLHFAINTSFKNEAERDSIISKTDELMIKLMYRLMRFLPLFIMRTLWEAKKRFRHAASPFSSGTYRYILKRYDSS